MIKKAPEGLWLALALAPGPEEVQELVKKYGRLGHGNQSEGKIILETVGGGFRHAVALSLNMLGKDLLKEWDPYIVKYLYSERTTPTDTIRLQLRDLINHGLQQDAVQSHVEWVGKKLVLGGIPNSLIGVAWIQLLKNFREPRPWLRCEYCSMPFPIRRKGAGRFCSDSCRVSSYQKQQRQSK
ncbi:MAG: hypothetical protein KZQ90_11640 [Candidatus Thiodiazotropha sp. (ex Codakia rugifera)]|nr:hypothetical protein [Candidatus Thiodiazotropha sp. (ex Codakia rugifera)]